MDGAVGWIGYRDNAELGGSHCVVLNLDVLGRVDENAGCRIARVWEDIARPDFICHHVSRYGSLGSIADLNTVLGRAVCGAQARDVVVLQTALSARSVDRDSVLLE